MPNKYIKLKGELNKLQQMQKNLLVRIDIVPTKTEERVINQVISYSLPYTTANMK